MNRTVPAEESERHADRVRRRFVLPGKRAPGLAILLVLPILGLSGVTALRADATAASHDLVFEADYPRVLRYLKPASMTLTVRNTSEADIAEATVHLPREYFEAYTELSMVPPVQEIDENGLVVQLHDIPAGEARYVRLELRANDYWWQRGTVSLSAAGQAAEIALATLVLP